MISAVLGVLLPFIGTIMGAACVLFMKRGFGERMRNALSGFAGGVMVAASVWSLLIPAMNMTEEAGWGKMSFVPAATGFLLGIFFLLMLDKMIHHLHVNKEAEGHKVFLTKSKMLLLAVTLHNIPEGMAVGIVFAGLLANNDAITLLGAYSVAIGIAIQNIPEGAIISMPLCADGYSKRKAFIYGILTGIVEPVGALLTIVLSEWLIPIMPCLLSFAAGAMVYVVVEELIPESAQGKHSNICTIGFAVGFTLMMAMDVALG